jgi:hypothetical protein
VITNSSALTYWLLCRVSWRKARYNVVRRPRARNASAVRIKSGKRRIANSAKVRIKRAGTRKRSGSESVVCAPIVLASVVAGMGVPGTSVPCVRNWR